VSLVADIPPNVGTRSFFRKENRKDIQTARPETGETLAQVRGKLQQALDFSKWEHADEQRSALETEKTEFISEKREMRRRVLFPSRPRSW
jgi:hypothetical protein